MKIINKTGFAITAATFLIAGCASDQNSQKTHAMDKGMDKLGQCHGVNSCKGHSACATAESTCMGNNSCKGKGWVSTSKTDCDAKGGKFMMK